MQNFEFFWERSIFLPQFFKGQLVPLLNLQCDPNIPLQEFHKTIGLIDQQVFMPK